MLFIIFLHKRSKVFFHFFNYSFIWILKYFAGISKPLCPRLEEHLFEPVVAHLIFSACLTKKCASFGRWPTVTNSLLINAVAYLLWTKDCRSSSCLADKIEPIGASQNDLKIWYPQTGIYSKNKFSFFPPYLISYLTAIFL